MHVNTLNEINKYLCKNTDRARTSYLLITVEATRLFNLIRRELTLAASQLRTVRFDA